MLQRESGLKRVVFTLNQILPNVAQALLMDSGAAGLPGVLVQGEGNQGVEPATTPPQVVVGRPAWESSMKAKHAKMKSCSIFGK